MSRRAVSPADRVREWDAIWERYIHALQLPQSPTHGGANLRARR